MTSTDVVEINGAKVETIDCSTVNCEVPVPQGYYMIPEATVNVAMALCVALVFAAVVSYRERIKKIIKNGI